MIAATVLKTVRERALLVPGDHVLVACSGGPDSTALLHVLHRLKGELGITLCAASIDHGLRPESADEVRRVGELADSLGVPFVPGQVGLREDGASLQARAREVRYSALHQIAAAQSAGVVAVGHTRDDQAETVLARLLRGAGIRGLRGIDARRDDRVVRPLIDCGRDDVLRYLESQDLPFVRDPSNHKRDFERVRIRHDVMPVLATEDPRVIAHLCAIADEAAELTAWVDRQTPPLPSDGTLEAAVADLRDLPSPLRTQWLRAWISRETGSTPSRAHLTETGRLLTGQGEVLLGSGWSVRRNGDRLLLEYREHRRTRSHRS